MKQKYSTKVENTTKFSHSYEPRNQQVGFKTSIRSENPMFSDGCDIGQIYNIIITDTPLHVSGIRKRAEQVCRGSLEKQTLVLSLVYKDDTINPLEYFSKLRELSNLYYYTKDKNPNSRAKKQINELKELIDVLKQLLPCIIFSANTLKHTTEAVKGAFNGVIQFDLDYHYYKGDRDAQALQESLRSDPHVYAAFISPSGFGLKIQFITNNSAEQYEQTRDAFSKYLTDQYQVEPTATKYGQKVNIIDKLPIAQTCYISYDPDIYTNYNAAPFNETFTEPAKVHEFKNYTGHTSVNIPASEAKRIIEDIIQQAEREQIDITQAAHDRWFRIGLAIAYHFGEAGREYFRQISIPRPTYTPHKTESQYNGFLKAKALKTPVTIATVIKYAQDAGIKVKTTGIEVVNPDQIIKVDEYVNEAVKELLRLIQEHDKLCIVAPTGSGKTRAFFEYILPQLEGKHIVALPYVMNVKQVERRFNCGALYGSLDFIDYAAAYDNKIIATTYDQAARLPGDTLVIDEAHNLAGQYDFRAEAIQAIEQAQRDKNRIILITATPSPMFQAEGFHVVEIKPQKKAMQRVKMCPYNDKNQKVHIIYKECEISIKTHKKALIKCNDIKTLEKVRKKLTKKYPGKHIAVLHRDQNNDNNPAAKAIQEGKFPFDILLCTSVINDGVSIDKTFVDRVVSIENQYYPSPKNLAQFFARLRLQTDKVEYICYYLQAKHPKQLHSANVISLYQKIKKSTSIRCSVINETIQPGEKPTEGENLVRIANYKNQITINTETGLFEPSTYAAMHDAEQMYIKTLSLDTFVSTIEANYPYITIEIERQYNIDQDKELQKELQQDKDLDKQQQRQIHKLIKEGFEDQILEYVCKNSTEFKVVKEIQQYQGIDKRNKLSDEARELYNDNKQLFDESFSALERVSLLLCVCSRYGIKHAENVVFNDDRIIRHGSCFNRIIDNIESHILINTDNSNLNRLSKHNQKVIIKALDAVTAINKPVTNKQIHEKIQDAIGSNEPYFMDQTRVFLFVKAFFNLKRYQANKSKRYYTIGKNVSLDEYTTELQINVNCDFVQKSFLKRGNTLNINDEARTPKNSLKNRKFLPVRNPGELPPTKKATAVKTVA